MNSDDSEHQHQDVVEPVTQWLTFVLGNEKYAVKVMQVQEVLRYTPIAPVPGAPMEVLGIINLRGNVVTVVALRKKFNMPSTENDDFTRIMMMDVQGHIMGVLVDKVKEVVYLKDSEIESAPDVNNSNPETSIFIQGIAHVDNELHILVNLDKLLSAEDLELLM